MQEEIMQRYREKLRPRLYDYLAAEKLLGEELDFACFACGGRARVADEGRWFCPDCGRDGGLLDLAALRWPAREEWDRIRSLCAALKIRVTELDTFSSRDLARMELKPREYLVEGLLPRQGVTLLAAPAKTGKSWMVLQLAGALVKGEPFLDRPTRQCGVLYLSLEDYPQRLQERCRTLNCLGSPDLHFCTRAELLGKGFEEGIDDFLQRQKGMGLLIVDTLQKIREVGREAPSYGMEYRTMDRLKEIAERYRMSVLLVHHTNKKEEALDAMNLVSGTMAITGGVDGIWLLRRPSRLEGKALMQITGRDTEDRLLRLDFDRESCRWRYLGEEDEPSAPVSSDRLIEAVSELLDEGEEWIGPASQLAEQLSERDPTLRLENTCLTRQLQKREEKLAQLGLHMEMRRGRQRNLYLYREHPEKGGGEAPAGAGQGSRAAAFSETEEQWDGENPFLF